MKWITLPTGEDKPAWAGLFAAVSMLFVFVDPYQRAYRPSSIAYFVLVAGFAPLAVGGSIIRSGAIVTVVVLVILAEWRLLWPPSMMPYVIALEAFLIGGALTFVARQQTAVRQLHKTAERERIAHTPSRRSRPPASSWNDSAKPSRCP